MRKLAFLSAFLAAGCAGLQIGGGGGEQVIAEGVAPYSGDLASARQSALAAAQRSAVEQVAGVFVTGQTQVQDAVALKQKILAATQGYIKRYKIISQAKEGDYYRVKIKAQVLVQDISAAFESLHRQTGGKILIFCSETLNGQTSQFGDAKAAMSEVFAKKNYVSVEPPSLLSSADVQNPQVLLEAARNAQADFLALCTADGYRLEGEMSGFSACRAKAGLKLISVRDSSSAAQSSKEASALDVSETVAARKAVSSAAALAAEEAASFLEGYSQRASAITLKVTSLSSLNQLIKFQESLRAIAGVEKFRLNQYSGGDAFFTVYVNGLAGEELAAMILRQSPFGLSAEVVTQYEIQLKAD